MSRLQSVAQVALITLFVVMTVLDIVLIAVVVHAYLEGLL